MTVSASKSRNISEKYHKLFDQIATARSIAQEEVWHKWKVICAVYTCCHGEPRGSLAILALRNFQENRKRNQQNPNRKDLIARVEIAGEEAYLDCLRQGLLKEILRGAA